MIELDSKLKFSNFFILLKEWLGWFLATAIMVYLGASPVGVVVMLGVYGYLALYKPKTFILITVMYCLLYQMFMLQQTYAGWGEFGGYARGWQTLGFLRRILPSSPGISNFYRVVYICILLVLVPRWWKNPNKFQFGKFQTLFLLFFLCWLVSAVVNGEFGKTSFRFWFQFTLPFVYYLYIKDVKYTPQERVNTFSILMFTAVEMQVVVSIVQNISKFPARIFFDDWAVGTFVFPFYEYSAYFLGMGFFYYFYKFLIDRDNMSILRAGIALYGILSISVVMFTLFMIAVVVFSLFYATSIGILKFKEFFIAGFVMLVMGYPIYMIFTDDSLESDTAHHTEKLAEKYEEREWWEHPKVYTFINLVDMMNTENRWFFGSGPGTFLTRFGSGPINEKYRTWAVYETTQLSSSEFLENTAVGMAGELGFQGYWVYMLLFIYLIKRGLKYISLKRQIMGRADPFATMIIMSGILFFVFAFVRNLLEFFPLTVFYVVLMEIGFKHINHELVMHMEAQNSQGPPPEPERQLEYSPA